MMFWQLPSALVLASKSQARRQVLEAAGLPIETRPADIDERSVERDSGLHAPSEIAGLLAKAKAKAVSKANHGRVVLGADQTLALDMQRFSKPHDRDSARAQLQALRGNVHELYSAVAVVDNGSVLFEYCGVARLRMRNFSEAFLETYLDRIGPVVTQSVGGYQLEKIGVQLFDSIEGDHFTILGMPILPLLEFFRSRGWILR